MEYLLQVYLMALGLKYVVLKIIYWWPGCKIIDFNIYSTHTKYSLSPRKIYVKIAYMKHLPINCIKIDLCAKSQTISNWMPLFETYWSSFLAFFLCFQAYLNNYYLKSLCLWGNLHTSTSGTKTEIKGTVGYNRLD